MKSQNNTPASSKLLPIIAVSLATALGCDTANSHPTEQAIATTQEIAELRVKNAVAEGEIATLKNRTAFAVPSTESTEPSTSVIQEGSGNLTTLEPTAETPEGIEPPERITITQTAINTYSRVFDSQPLQDHGLVTPVVYIDPLHNFRIVGQAEMPEAKRLGSKAEKVNGTTSKE